jgi:hypothetical protein
MGRSRRCHQKPERRIIKMIVYKAVFKTPEKQMVSMCHMLSLGKKIKELLTLQYRLGETTIPKFGSIMAFKEKKHLDEWIRYLHSPWNSFDFKNIVVLKGKGKKSEENVENNRIIPVCNMELLDVEKIKSWWQRRGENRSLALQTDLNLPNIGATNLHIAPSIAPKGTVFLDNFTPEEILEEHNMEEELKEK